MTAVAGVSPDPALVGKRFLEAMITGDHDGLDALCAPYTSQHEVAEKSY